MTADVGHKREIMGATISKILGFMAAECQLLITMTTQPRSKKMLTSHFLNLTLTIDKGIYLTSLKHTTGQGRGVSAVKTVLVIISS